MLAQVSQAAALPLHIDSVKAHLVIDHNDDDGLLAGYIASAVKWAEDHTNRALVQQSWVNLQNCFGESIQLNVLPILVVDSIKYIDSNDAEQAVDPADYRTGFSGGKITLKSGSAWPSTLLIEEGICTAFQAGYLIPLSIDITADILTARDIVFADDQAVFLSTNNTMPAGLSEKKPYYVVNSTGSSFQLSKTQSGTVIDLTNIGAGDLFAGELSQAIEHALLLLIGHWYNNRENVITGVTVNEIPMGVESLLNPYKAYL